MTLMIDLAPEMERRLEEEAAKRGLPAAECARVLLEGVLELQEPPLNAQTLTPEERRARVDAIAGKYAHLPGSVEEFLKWKHEDIEREEERWQRRHGGGDP